MSSFHAAGRRPIPDVRNSHGGHGDGASARHRLHAGAAPDRDLDAELAVLVERAVDAIRAGGARPDAVFGEFAELNSFVRAVTYHEGKLLEWGLERLVADNPSHVLMPRETALPIVPAALELLERNDWNSLEGLRLRSEVHYKTTYSPDLFLVDRDRHAALLLDVKRSLASYPERKLNALRKRMMAAALIAGDWLHLEGRVAGVSKVDIAIIDGSNVERDHVRGIFALDEIGELIDVAHAGDAMMRLRIKFAQRIQYEIHKVCRRALRGGRDDDRPATQMAIDANASDAADEPDADDAEFADKASGFDSLAAGRLMSFAPGTQRQERRPVKVGFARGRSGP